MVHPQQRSDGGGQRSRIKALDRSRLVKAVCAVMARLMTGVNVLHPADS